MVEKNVVIGLTGQIASGKGLLADILQDEYNFAYFSLSHRVREIVQARGIADVTRKILQDIGDETRRNFGGDIFAKLTASYAFVKNSPRVVIDSIRNPAEAEFLKIHPNFTLVAIRASQYARFDRVIKRSRPSDPKTFEEFITFDMRDFGINQDDLGQQVGKCVELADFILYNNATPKEFCENIRELVSIILKK